MIALHPLMAAKSATRVRPDRPATAIVHDSAQARLVAFHLAPGQCVPLHTSGSLVVLHVLEGSAVISVGDEQRRCAAGEVVVCQPHEPHGMRADDEELVLLATIAPRP